MEQLYFTKEGIWSGGYYELALEVGETVDEKLEAALRAIWQHPSLQGCFLERNREPGEQQPVELSKIPLESGLHLQGLARLPNDSLIACGTCLIREKNGSDWLDFYLPMGSLAQVYDVGAYPFDENENSPAHWQKAVDDWLAEIGASIYAKVRYKLGLIGFEVLGELYAKQLEEAGIPHERRIGYLWPSDATVEYFAKNM
jgi:hypothetical protein